MNTSEHMVTSAPRQQHSSADGVALGAHDFNWASAAGAVRPCSRGSVRLPVEALDSVRTQQPREKVGFDLSGSRPLLAVFLAVAAFAE
jgi:hypothetical protein